jgi:xanthine dehydrogenase FAD-binding subunit
MNKDRLEANLMPKFDYVRPESIAEALTLLNDTKYVNKALAGGTDVMVYLHLEAPEYDRVVDISRLAELKVITQDHDQITIGGAVTFSEIIESSLLQEAVPFLIEASQQVGGPQIQNMGTLAGNVVNAAACADSLPVLVCLDAVAHLKNSSGERQLAVTELVAGPHRAGLQPGELLTHFTFSMLPDGAKSAFIKLGRRNAQTISRMTVAAYGRQDSDGNIDHIHFAPGATTPRTMRLTGVEDLLLGQRLDDKLLANAGKKASDEMIKITGRRWSTPYKEPVLATLTERVLRLVFDS